jgi:hypothetical protein
LALFADEGADNPINGTEAMRVVHDRRRSRQAPDALTVEDLLISTQVLDVELVDSEYLTEAGREPRKFLPPPRLRVKRPATASREPENRLSKVAKLAGLTTAASLLVSAVVASSMLTRERQAEPGRSAVSPPQITGAAALGGFVADPGKAISGEQSDRHYDPPRAVSTSQVPVAATQPAAPATTSVSPTTTTAPPEVTNAEKLAAVSEFYRRMASPRPEEALTMLAPDLAGAEPGRLVRAWSTMSDVHVDQAEVQPDGSVRAMVTMLQHDGTKLRVTQVLTVAKGTTDLITRAVLLSADQL